ncbi:MAG: Holliday junction branch migration protein RuvA [Actinomycetota bacterium]|jgi:Holliday junction DNA helicase RuvA|nr:Holliday junction branch migration protein RuvA [Rubrobacter sp.]MDQ3507844.1 Holliday junction branch migration protein RuvA [Actinomycetota bacterium]
MIHRLRGQLVEKDNEGVTVDCGGVGYRTLSSITTVQNLPPVGEECVVHTRMVVREDAMLLFGFATKDERAVFDALTGVSKVGPKMALAVLSAMKPREVSEAVARGDVLKFASVSGLGKKTAERLVLELKGKEMAFFEAEPSVSGNGSGAASDSESSAFGGPYMEAREALTGLGYSLDEAEYVLNEVPPQETVEAYIKAALRKIGGRR